MSATYTLITQQRGKNAVMQQGLSGEDFVLALEEDVFYMIEYLGFKERDCDKEHGFFDACDIIDFLNDNKKGVAKRDTRWEIYKNNELVHTTFYQGDPTMPNKLACKKCNDCIGHYNNWTNDIEKIGRQRGLCGDCAYDAHRWVKI